MKRFLIGLVGLVSFLALDSAWAFQSDSFRGAYEIVGERKPGQLTANRQFISFDVDKLEVMWARYASGPFPADLEPYRTEPAVLVRFTNRDAMFFTLEANLFFGPDNEFLIIRAETSQFELHRRPDGTFLGGLKEQANGTIFDLRKM